MQGGMKGANPLAHRRRHSPLRFLARNEEPRVHPDLTSAAPAGPRTEPHRAELIMLDPDFPARTVPDLLAAGARTRPSAEALRALGRPGLDHASLAAEVDALAAELQRRGLRRTDRVAMVLPNGPAMALAFLGGASAGVAAPLNPAYGVAELDFYLEDLSARMLLVGAGLDTPAREVARRRGIAIVEVADAAGAAGLVTLDGVRVPASTEPPARPAAADIALVLHTSGTTSRPKMVPLAHANLCASAYNVGAALRLDASDTCLNVMPLFHIHGLVAALLASLAAGGSVICTPGFDSPAFLGWARQLHPTWYTAVPTMHQAILARAEAVAASERPALRLIRSSSAPLPRATHAELERIFGAPVIEAYGMTEAAHQMASNPLPPAARKPGSVGIAAGPEVAIMDAEGALLPSGATGEVVIRGETVTAGYLANAEANAAAYSAGWFRTGDQGHLDADGYLFLTGRLKEQINRGGEKVSPIEIDDALMAHPAVAQAVAFGMPHPTLGEEVAAAAVLRSGAVATERELREFVAERLAYFKVPRRIVLLDAIPKGATGKLQRIGLAARLGLVSPEADAPTHEYLAPRTPLEEILAAIWSDVLQVAAPGVLDHFFHAGGDSLLATKFVARVRAMLGVELTLLTFFDGPTVAHLAAAIEPHLGDSLDAVAPHHSPTS
jgi:acyl-CoA synthetase (AMP-forming)/AMP-acid ligase II